MREVQRKCESLEGGKENRGERETRKAETGGKRVRGGRKEGRERKMREG